MNNSRSPQPNLQGRSRTTAITTTHTKSLTALSIADRRYADRRSTTPSCLDQRIRALLRDRQHAASLAAIELGVDDERRCPHCASAGAVSRGKARGLRRYRCKACGKTFGALTGTALSGLHHKERWLAFGASLGAGETIREAAERCGIAPSTAHRWRRRFLAAVRQAPDRLAGIVEADERFVLESRKGERKLDRKPRRRGGKARKRGPSREQVPILVAADRAGATLSQTLPALLAEALDRAERGIGFRRCVASWRRRAMRSRADLRPPPYRYGDGCARQGDGTLSIIRTAARYETQPSCRAHSQFVPRPARSADRSAAPFLRATPGHPERTDRAACVPAMPNRPGRIGKAGDCRELQAFAARPSGRPDDL